MFVPRREMYVRANEREGRRDVGDGTYVRQTIIYLFLFPFGKRGFYFGIINWRRFGKDM